MIIRSISFPLFVGATLLLTPPSYAASLLEGLGLVKSKSTHLPAEAGTGTALTEDQM